MTIVEWKARALQAERHVEALRARVTSLQAENRTLRGQLAEADADENSCVERTHSGRWVVTQAAKEGTDDE